MANFIKKATSVVDAGIVDESGTTQVNTYTRMVNSKNSDTVIERSLGEFEKNEYRYTASFFLNKEDNNPILNGLKILNKAAMVISGKRPCSTFEFEPKMLCSTPLYISETTLEEANIIILKNLGMYEAISAGLAGKKTEAIKFNNLSLAITKDVRRGNPVYTKYKEEALEKGLSAIREWNNNANV